LMKVKKWINTYKPIAESKVPTAKGSHMFLTGSAWRND
jgi:hypothetical protein